MPVALGMLYASGPFLFPSRQTGYIWDATRMVMAGRDDDGVKSLNVS